MAPIRPSKRARAPVDEIDSTNGGKRPRQSYNYEIGDQSPSENEAVVDAQHEEDDAIYNHQTQQVERELKNTENMQNIPAESGIIEEIRCTNFMCHEQLTVPLGPLINFIIGHNGSGKSAVLTALTLCLGGKAVATNRGQNLKSFIKEGREKCTLFVKIKNQGAAAYKPDIYGRSIIVERHFTRSGSSGFSLKDVNGKVVSTRKALLEDILDAFALQLDNPMNVLTQDMARQFLNDSTPNIKYKFFLKGTQLETLMHDYGLIKYELDEMQNKAETVKADVEVLKKHFQQARTRAQRAANLHGMRDRERLLAHQAAWAQVEEEERKLEKIDEEINGVNKIIEERNAEADRQSEQFALADHAYNAAEQTVQERQAELEPIQQEVESIDAQWKETKADLTTLKTTTQREIGSKIRNKAKTIESYEKQIQELRQRQTEADNGQHAQKLVELEEAKEDSERAKNQLSEHDEGLQTIQDKLRAAQRKKSSADQKIQEKRQEVQRAKDHITELGRGGQRNWTDSYPTPRSLDGLLRTIGAERQFREPPVGPIGRHVKILQPEWGSILERSFGSSLNAFVVTSKADQAVLSDLMRKLNCQYPIYIGQNRPIDTADQEPDAQQDTWLRVLNIDNDLVRNQLIINHRIEQVVLIKDRASAETFMHQGGQPRRNVKMCFTMADGDPTKGHMISVNATSGSINFGPIFAWLGKHRMMQGDKEGELRVAQSNLQRVQEELSNESAQVRALQSEVDHRQRTIEDHKRQKRTLTARYQQAQEKVESLDEELNASTPDAGQIEHLEHMLEEAQKEKEFEEEQYQDTVLQEDKLSTDARAHKDSLEDAQRRRDQMNVMLGKLSGKAEKQKSKREEALRQKNAALEAVQAAENNKGEWEQDRGKQMENLEATASMAEEITGGGRVPVPEGETFESLNRKRLRLRQEREDCEKQLGGSENELQEAALTAQKKHKDANDELAAIEHLTDHLKKSLVHRERRWNEFRKWISARARIMFTYLLSERSFRGDLKVDHKSQQLDIQVQPDITVASSAGRQTKTLSGGEKSFSTICLLLSIWDAMGSPIRCLDEFDVFMDNVNRTVTMDMMIKAARRSIGRQYILITPQAMNNVQSVDDVKIIRMHDPERGQTALNTTRM